MYHIEGYRITKIKGELMLKIDRHVKDKGEEGDEIVNEEITELRNEIKNIKDTVNKLIEYVNNTLKSSVTEQ